MSSSEDPGGSLLNTLLVSDLCSSVLSVARLSPPQSTGRLSVNFPLSTSLPPSSLIVQVPSTALPFSDRSPVYSTQCPIPSVPSYVFVQLSRRAAGSNSPLHLAYRCGSCAGLGPNVFGSFALAVSLSPAVWMNFISKSTGP